jgi:hypothetical protein
MQPGQSGDEDYDKFSLPTGSGFVEDILEFGPRRLVTDAQFGRSGPKCFSCDELKAPTSPRLASSQSDTATDQWARSFKGSRCSSFAPRLGLVTPRQTFVR